MSFNFFNYFSPIANSKATILINDQPLAGSVNLTFPVSKGVFKYNFTVSKDDDIKVAYLYDYFTSSNTFKVYAGMNGTGQQIIFSPIMLTLESIPNPCSTTTCTYYLAIYTTESSVVAYFSIYVSGVAAIYDAPAPVKGSTTWYSFNVTQGDEIQLLSNFPYNEGGFFGFLNSIYDAPSYSGTMIWSFTFAYKGLPAITQVPNFCGQNLKLNLSDINYTPGQESIEIAVVPSFLASTQFPVNLKLVCNSQTLTQNRISSLNMTQKFDFNTSTIADASGCYFIASASDTINNPYADSQKLFIPIPVTYVLPSQIEIYKQGGSLPVLLNTSDSSVTTATVTLNCKGQGSSKSVKILTTSYMTIPLGYFTNCTVTISGLKSPYYAPNSTITIKTTDFVSPFGSGISIIPLDQQAAAIQKFYGPGKYV